MKHTKQNISKKNRRKYNKTAIVPLAFLVVFSFYIIFAYNFFYKKMGSYNVEWPGHEDLYEFGDTTKNAVHYVSIGDSLTYGSGAGDFKNGYTYSLAQEFAKNYDGLYLNDFSYPGIWTDDVIKQLDDVIRLKPDIITVFIGTNDVHQLIDAGNFTKNYETILSRLSQETDATIYTINLPYIGTNALILPPLNAFFRYKIKAANKSIEKLAKKYGAVNIDLYTPNESARKTENFYCRDQYHPSVDGYRAWADIIKHDLQP